MSQSPGKQPTADEVQQIIREVDLDGDGTINFNGKFHYPVFYSNIAWETQIRKEDEQVVFGKLIRNRVHHDDDRPDVPSSRRKGRLC